jgi:hypothetical protein
LDKKAEKVDKKTEKVDQKADKKAEKTDKKMEKVDKCPEKADKKADLDKSIDKMSMEVPKPEVLVRQKSSEEKAGKVSEKESDKVSDKKVDKVSDKVFDKKPNKVSDKKVDEKAEVQAAVREDEVKTADLAMADTVGEKALIDDKLPAEIDAKAEAEVDSKAEEKSEEVTQPEVAEKQLLKRWRKQKKLGTTSEPSANQGADQPPEAQEAARSSVEEQFENLGYVSGDDTANYADETYHDQNVSPARAAVSTPAQQKKEEPCGVRAEAEVCDATAVAERPAEDAAVEKEVAVPAEEPTQAAPQESEPQSLQPLPEQDQEMPRTSCALENVPPQQHQPQHMATAETPSSQSLGVYTPDSATNSVHSMHAGYGGQGELVSGADALHSNVMESPNSISSVEAVSLPPPTLLPQQMPHPQSYSDGLHSQQQQQAASQSLVPPAFVGYATPGPHHQVPTPPSPSVNVVNQQQQQLSSPLMSAAPSPHQVTRYVPTSCM